MNTNRRLRIRATLIAFALIGVAVISTRHKADTGTCSTQVITLPFTDIAGSGFFCTIAEAYFSGLTNGTDATHYSPTANVTRDQMSAFITRTLDQSLKRGSERAALDQFWTTQTTGGLGITDLNGSLLNVKSDGLDLWVTDAGNATVHRVRSNTGNLLETWTGAAGATGVIVARGSIFITGFNSTNPSKLYSIDPTQPAGPVTTVTNSLAPGAEGIAYDGQRIWTSNSSSVSRVSFNPVTVVDVVAGSIPSGILYDGANIWVSYSGESKLKKLDSSGTALLSVTVGASPLSPVFDGTNIWVPSFTDNTVSVVRAKGAQAGTILATLSGNGLDSPRQTAFDGERILVVNASGSVSLWRATDFSPLGNVSTGGTSSPEGACSDGVNFWIAMANGKLARL